MLAGRLFVSWLLVHTIFILWIYCYPASGWVCARARSIESHFGTAYSSYLFSIFTLLFLPFFVFGFLIYSLFWACKTMNTRTPHTHGLMSILVTRDLKQYFTHKVAVIECTFSPNIFFLFALMVAAVARVMRWWKYDSHVPSCGCAPVCNMEDAFTYHFFFFVAAFICRTTFGSSQILQVKCTDHYYYVAESLTSLECRFSFWRSAWAIQRQMVPSIFQIHKIFCFALRKIVVPFERGKKSKPVPLDHF